MALIHNIVGNPQAGWFGLGIKTYESFSKGFPDADPHHLGESSWLGNVDTFWTQREFSPVYACTQNKLENATLCNQVG